ncbi:hypothetical protein ACK3GY_002120 [Vibrio parahaemolyticus]
MSKAVYVYQGVKGLPAIAKHTGVPFTTLSYRVYQLKMNIAEAVKGGSPKAIESKHEYKGIRGLKNIANAYNFPPKTLESRVVTMGMDIETALKKPIRHRAYTGKPEYTVDSLWALALGIGGSHA